jgi:hypothetical protein
MGQVRIIKALLSVLIPCTAVHKSSCMRQTVTPLGLERLLFQSVKLKVPHPYAFLFRKHELHRVLQLELELLLLLSSYPFDCEGSER